MRQVLLFILFVFFGTADAELIVTQGPVTLRTASIWIQADAAAQAKIEFWTEAIKPRQTGPITLSTQQDFTAQLSLTDLKPGTLYRYRVMLDGRPAKEGQFFTLPAWRSNGRPFDFTVYFGSCAYLQDARREGGSTYGGGEEIFDHIAGQALANPLPGFMLWGGDTVYYREADYESAWGMNARQRSVRHHPTLQKLFTALPHYAIWDDHDYGPNDSNRSFVLKESSLELFKRYWANPSYGLPLEPGIFTGFSVSDADFFLLDDRWYRGHDRSPDYPGKQMYGVNQLNWLKNALLTSRARFKIIVGGSQFLNDTSKWEGWHHFKSERQDFLDWLEKSRIDGVIFLSGDRHRTELLKIDRPGAYPLYELTCSPLTSQPRKAADETHNPQRVEGTLTEQRNFCTLDFSGESKNRALTLRSFDTEGKKLWRVSVPAETLKVR